MAESVILTIFGGTGDLAKRKLVEAFASLVRDDIVSKDSTLIGIGRTEFTDETYKKFLLEGKDKKTKDEIDKVKIKYFIGDVSNPSTLVGLKGLIESVENDICCTHRLFYLSTSFLLFPKITQFLKSQNLHISGKNVSTNLTANTNNKITNFQTKVIFEKPFGYDLKSNDSFEKEMQSVFGENQIYRIDHYLGKETVMNITTLKFENPVIDAMLRKEHVKKIEIIVDEDLAVGKRVSYYNEFGAIKDMIQSHLLQVLSLILMERPITMTPEGIHAEKIKMLQQIKLNPLENNLLGQYKSYSEEIKKYKVDMTDKTSNTETFAKLHFNCSHERWNGTDIILRTGKMLPKKFGKIVVTFKSNTLSGNNSNNNKNTLTINIQPIQDVDFNLNIIKDDKLQNVVMNFCHACRFGPNSSDGYEKMIHEIILGNHTLFANSKEIQESWRIVEEIEKVKSKINFVVYDDYQDPELS
jgi:glucose-6-phosphate 1-dehydrogenase